ncbi:MAG: V-type ATP synthase subunit D [Candidatus Parvarchaeota archaeon]|nr:V-type ATP synthase subunit D [Candidatus Parvarchaeota archaeon]
MASGRNEVSSIKTTRLELIKTKARIRTAERGLDQLKMKRKKLIFTFFDIVKQIRMTRNQIKSAMQNAMDSIKIAEMLEGKTGVELVAEEQSQMVIDLDANNVMGVFIPQVNLGEGKKSELIDTILSLPIAIGDAKISYLELFKIIIDISQREAVLRKLLLTIQKLNMRINTIEYNIIPRLAFKVNYIRQKLEDFERDRIVSLKYIKRMAEL